MAETVRAGGSTAPLDRYAWYPQPGPQTAAYTATWCPEIFFGGGKFGGKSDFLIGDFGQDVELYGPNWHGILFRQTLPELEEIMRRAWEIYPRLGGVYESTRKLWSFPQGSTLKLRYLENVKDFYHYNGHSYTWIGADELPQHPTGEGYHMLKGCLRWGAAEVPRKRIRASGNPGGPGHGWVSDYFKLLEYPMGYKAIWDERGKMCRMYIPSRATDNRLGLTKDPGYIDRLYNVGGPDLVRAWLENDWSIISGAYFTDRLFICRPVELPKYWVRTRSYDHGTAKPFSVGWWAVSDGAELKLDFGDGLTRFWVPPGCAIRYREWYGAAGPDKGLKLTAREIGRGIREREQGEQIAYGVADPSIFIEAGGPSVAEEFLKEGINWLPADNSRLAGWEQFRARTRGDSEGRPGVIVFNTCKDFIRAYPLAQHDPHRPEDVDCFVAGTLISTPGGDRAVESLKIGDLVNTPIGPRKVYICGEPKATECHKVEFEDGRSLVGTSLHKVFVEGVGLVSLDQLDCNATVAVWNTSNLKPMHPLLTRVLNIEGIGTGAIITLMVGGCRKGLLHCIGKYLLMPLALFLEAWLYIIKITTRTIILLRIWKCWRLENMHAYTLERDFQGGHYGTNLPNGEPASLVRKRFEAMRKRCALELLNGNFRALIVGLLLRQKPLLQSSAINATGVRGWLNKFVRFAGGSSYKKRMASARPSPVRINAVGSCGVAEVYRLRVEHAHLYYANGFLVSNTRGEDHALDESRYFFTSRPWAVAEPRVYEPPKQIEDIKPTFNQLLNQTARSKSGYKRI